MNMAELVSIFLNNLLPMILIAGAGYLAARWLDVRPAALSKVVFYLFSPCLIFDLLVASQLALEDIVRMLLFAAVIMLGVGALTWLIGRAFIRDRKLLVAVVLSTTLMNAGALGIPLIEFSLGEEALAYASLFFVAMLILTYTVGVGIASLGAVQLQQVLQELLQTPALYAVVGAFVFMAFEWHFPAPIQRSISTLSAATIPVMLVLLGVQLHEMEGTLRVGPLVYATFMRLGGGLVCGILISALFGLGGAARQAGILEAAMPSAIVTTVLATEYDVKPDFVTTVVFTTTLLSPLTLTPLLSFVGS